MTAEARPLEPTVHIGRVIQNAVVFKFGRSGANVNTDELPKVVAELFDLLEARRVEYVLVGGVALLQYVAGRNTEDIDLILSLRALESLPEIEVSSRNVFFARGAYKSLTVDVLLTENRLFERVRREFAAVRRFVERDIPTASVEGLVLLKLYALPSLYREGDFGRVSLYENDLAALLQAYRPPLEPLLHILEAHLSPSELEEVREVLGEIEARIERFRKRSGEAGSA